MTTNQRMLAVLVITLGLLLASCGSAKLRSGDPEVGERLFNTNLEGRGDGRACSECHSLDGTRLKAPSLMEISQHSIELKAGVTVEEFLRQSILEPEAVNDGDYPDIMPTVYGDVLTEQQVNDLIAFLLSQ